MELILRYSNLQARPLQKRHRAIEERRQNLSHRKIIRKGKLQNLKELFRDRRFLNYRRIVPSPEKIKQIWFTFNLVANYINNKNLKPGGRPEKLASWLEAVQIVYPNNPYMSLFAGLSHVMLGSAKPARRHLDITKKNLQGSEYWNRRFAQFNLTSIVSNFPQNADEVQKALELLQKRYSEWTG